MARSKTSARVPHVVIVGGGFGGLAAARALRRAPVRVTLIDRRNHHLFQPLLYQVATAGLSPGDIAYPIRSVLRRQKNARVLLGDVTRIDRSARAVTFDGGVLPYDYLIIATGATHSYFGHDDWAGDAPGLKTVEDAVEIRRRILLAYEAAERESDPELQREWLTFVVVGAGPTGVELAGVLAEIANHTLVRDFRAIDPSMARVILVEGLDRVLVTYPTKLSERAKEQLERLGVEVRLGERVTAIDERGVLAGGERIASRTVLWAAGVQASPLALTLDSELDQAGRVRVSPELTVSGDDRVFVIGDLASLEQDGRPLPGVAPAAIQGGKHAARTIRADLRGAPRPRFRYRDKGSLATIGRAAAVASIGRLEFSGFFAWVAWWAVHLFFLIGFRNRILVMFGWIWSYLTFQRGARLITGELPRLPAMGAVPGRPAGERAADVIRLDRTQTPM
jgi:NADH dehydrogenase